MIWNLKVKKIGTNKNVKSEKDLQRLLNLTLNLESEKKINFPIL
jgi:hypothetical protein